MGTLSGSQLLFAESERRLLLQRGSEARRGRGGVPSSCLLKRFQFPFPAQDGRLDHPQFGIGGG